MSLLDSVNNFATTLAEKARQDSILTKIVSCLPSILTSLPAALGAAAGSVVGAGANIVKNLVSGANGLLLGVVNETVARITNAVTGLLNTILNIEAQLVASFNQLKALTKYLEREALDTAEWIKNKENCKFAAAELVNCIVGRLLTQLSTKFSDRISGSLNLSKLDSSLDRITDLVEEPAARLSGWVDNAAREVDRAASRVNAAKQF